MSAWLLIAQTSSLLLQKKSWLQRRLCVPLHHSSHNSVLGMATYLSTLCTALSFSRCRLLRLRPQHGATCGGFAPQPSCRLQVFPNQLIPAWLWQLPLHVPFLLQTVFLGLPLSLSPFPVWPPFAHVLPSSFWPICPLSRQAP